MIDTDKLKPRWDDPFIVLKEYIEWYAENAPAIQARGGHTTIAFTSELLAEVKQLREQLKKEIDTVKNYVDYSKDLQREIRQLRKEIRELEDDGE